MNEEISIEQAAQLLSRCGGLFTQIFKHASLLVEFYKPDKVDHHQPHDRAYHVTATLPVKFNVSE